MGSLTARPSSALLLALGLPPSPAIAPRNFLGPADDREKIAGKSKEENDKLVVYRCGLGVAGGRRGAPGV